MPSPSRSPDLNSRYHAFIADWLSALLFSMVTGIEDDAEVIDFMFSPDYRAVYDGVYELVSLPDQTPFTLFHIVVFSSRLCSRLITILSPAEFSTDVIEEFLAMLKIFYFMALQAMGEVTLSDDEQLCISGLDTLSEYRSIKETLTDEVRSPPHTGTLEIGHVEWENYLRDIDRLMVPMPYGDADLNDMQATMDALLRYMQFDSTMGNIPLTELAIFQSFPPSHSDSPTLPSPMLDTDLVSLSAPSTSSLPSHSFSPAPSTSSEPEWNPTVESGRNVATGSAQAVYDLDGIPSNPMSLANLVHGYPQSLITLHHPKPRRVIQLDLIELQASMVQEDSAAPVQLVTEASHITTAREARRLMLLMNGMGGYDSRSFPHY